MNGYEQECSCLPSLERPEAEAHGLVPLEAGKTPLHPLLARDEALSCSTCHLPTRSQKPEVMGSGKTVRARE